MIVNDLSTLKIHKLSQEQYDRELAAGRIDADAIYLTPDEGVEIATPDWNQNDESAPDYIKNRPFYTGDLVDVELVSIDESEWEEMSQIDDTRSEWVFSRTPKFGLVVGQEYKVICNGITYTYNAQ